MATYRSIVGQKIKKVTSDPSNPIEGQMWYNSTSGILKVRLTAPGAWAASNTFPDSRRAGYTTGTQTASIYAGGYTSGTVDTTKSYNGTSWSSGPTFYESKFLGGTAGTQTAAITFCGNCPAGANRNSSGTWNGSSWTSGPTVPVGNQGNSGFGTSTAAVTCGGSGDYDYSAEWNGSSWTAGNNMNVDRYGAGGSGTQTAGLASGGTDSPGTALSTSSSYDGTNWTAGSALTEAKKNMYGGLSLASGGTSSTLISGGNDASTYTTNCQIFDGTSFFNTGVLGTARYGNQSGDSTSALFSAGYNGSNMNNTEEFTGPFLDSKTVTTG